MAVAACVAAVGPVATAAACSCPGEPEAAASVQFADVVFEGTVLSPPEAVRAELGIDGYSGTVRFRFEVARYYKGRLGSEASIYTIGQGSACGASYSVGSVYLVYARELENGTLTDSLCSRTRLLTQASQDLELLGDGVDPNPTVQPQDVVSDMASDESCSAAPVGAGNRSSPALSCALLLAGALARRRRGGGGRTQR